MLEHSTQYNNWCFINKEQEFENLKQQKLAKYRKIYQRVLTKNPQADIQLFSLEDENVILNFYITQISQLCQSFPLKVEASAISFFKRFYLKSTILVDPKKYLFTSVYLALKTEEVPVQSFEMLAKSIKDPFFDKFPEFEEDILKAINFDLKIYHPFTPLLSLLERLKEDEKIKWDVQKFTKVYNECIKMTRLCFLDYIIFEIPHGVIALGVFLIVLNRNNIDISDNPVMADILAIPEDVKAKIEELKVAIEKYESFSLKEEALKALKKIKSYYHNQNVKEEFARPVEKHPHPNPPEQK